ncbi:MAG: hypothetical protein FD170_3148 [Bacteroidetes bacterium]|nr:MAG: hypothetical protein FD170_3148 [Bacteroidota bacterium]
MNISCFSTTATIELLMTIIMLAGLMVLIFHLYGNKKRIISARIIQFACICLLIPTIVILSLEKILSGETTATLLAGIAGYILAGIKDYNAGVSKIIKEGDKPEQKKEKIEVIEA